MKNQIQALSENTDRIPQGNLNLQKFTPRLEVFKLPWVCEFLRGKKGDLLILDLTQNPEPGSVVLVCEPGQMRLSLWPLRIPAVPGAEIKVVTSLQTNEILRSEERRAMHIAEGKPGRPLPKSELAKETNTA